MIWRSATPLAPGEFWYEYSFPTWLPVKLARLEVDIPKGRAIMPGPVDPSRLLVCELADGAFEGVSGSIKPDWDAGQR